MNDRIHCTCGRFIAAATFRDHGPDVTGQSICSWHCTSCGFIRTYL